MMLSSSDNQTIKDITVWYCVYSLVVFSALIPGLLLSGHYLLLGSCEILPVFVVIFFLESFKWLYGRFKYFKEFSIAKVDPKPLKFLLHVLSNMAVSEVFYSVLTLLGSITLFFCISVLFGAPLITRHEETLMFSILISILIVFPTCLNLGHSFIIQTIFGKKPSNALQRLFQKNIQSTLIGAWFGAFVIPLDWDRPWQKWPVSCSTGALIGYFMSHVIVFITIQLSSSFRTVKLPKKKH